MQIMQTPFHLDKRIILVTGASSGIGRQVAISASKMGARLVLHGRNQEKLQETLGMLEGDNHQLISSNLLTEEGRNALVAQAPAIDGLVHCAGVVHPYPIRFLDQKKIDETLNINFEAPVLMTGALVKNKKISKNASLVFLSSISGQHPHKGGAMYGSSKAALETFVKVVALELYPQGIRCNCLSPGMVQTPMYEQAEKDMSKEEMDKHVSRYPLGPGLPEDVANAAIFFLSDASRWITGVNLTLDGGFLLEG
ncbi:MAG: short-chain dehydrogenase/reductase sdr [Bacteroidetes bacterium]|nr:MAG: short-chain dehydrogenase/reductase sdr [Bacteroidota bacterium]